MQNSASPGSACAFHRKSSRLLQLQTVHFQDLPLPPARTGLLRYRLGRRVLYKQSDLDIWMECRRVDPKDQPRDAKVPGHAPMRRALKAKGSTSARQPFKIVRNGPVAEAGNAAALARLRLGGGLRGPVHPAFLDAVDAGYYPQPLEHGTRKLWDVRALDAALDRRSGLAHVLGRR